MEENNPTPVWETATGRKISYKQLPQSSFYRIAFVDEKGGLMPLKYSGAYTGVASVTNAIIALVKETWATAEANNHSKRKIS